MKMMLKNGDGSTTEIGPNDERYAVMQRNARTALASLITLVVKNVLTVVLALGIVLVLVFHSVGLSIALAVFAVATIVVSRMHIHYRQRVRANAKAWQERYGTWQQPAR
jgi:uncharacterized membrane protein